MNAVWRMNIAGPTRFSVHPFVWFVCFVVKKFSRLIKVDGAFNRSSSLISNRAKQFSFQHFSFSGFQLFSF
jgi:energy-converting hydrogenase Eha subunit G